MRLRNILLVVSDVEYSTDFYRELFGLQVVTDFGEKVILTEGLVLHERKSWEAFVQREANFGGHDAELYFEENNIDMFLERLADSRFAVDYICKREGAETRRRVIQLYDPDRHVIEVAEAVKEN